MDGEEEAAAGAVLGFAGLGLAGAGGVTALVLVVVARGRPSAASGGTWWALFAAALGIVFAVGTAMDWVQTSVRATTRGVTFNATGTAELQRRCCSLSDLSGWDLAGTVATMAAAVLVVLAAAAWRPGGTAVGGLIGAGLVMAAHPLATIVSTTEMRTPADLGFRADQVREAGLIVVDRGATLGLWVAALAAVAVVVCGVLRAVQLSSAPR